MQLLEQILVLFNPALEIQSTDNYIDWTSLTVCNLENVVWSSRTIPVNADNPIDIATLTFSIPIWISSPAMVKKLGVVERIVAQVFDAQGDASNAILDNDLLLGTRQVFTPYGYQALLIGNKLQALRQQQVVDEPNSSLEAPTAPPSNLLWHNIVNLYGVLRPGISYVSLEQDDGSEVIGTVAFDPTDDRFLLLTIDADTVPANTLAPIDAVIDPLLSGPGSGLPVAVAGQRYLILNDIGSADNPAPAVAWGSLLAVANNIIQFDGNDWIVAFDSSTGTNIQYTTNITTGLQYLWTGEQWVKSYEGIYPSGSWSIVL
jgi:hypothetical protein